MSSNKISSEQQFIRNLLMRFFTALFIVFVLTMIALSPKIITLQNAQGLPSVIIQNCYDGDTCTTKQGEKIRLSCIDSPELRGKRADPIKAKAAKDYLNNLVVNSTVSIRRIATDRYGRTIAELFQGPINIQEELVKQGYARIYERYAIQCEWSNEKE